MPPKVKVNAISEPSEDNVSYDAIVEASNVKQLLDNEDCVNTSQETQADDVGVVKKARPKRSPKKKSVAVGETLQPPYIDQFNIIECCIPTAKEDLLGCNPSEHGVRHEQPKEDDLLGCDPSEQGVLHEEEPKKNVKVIELKECEKCGKKLTARTLKYSHAAVCPANENTPPAKSRKKKAITPDDDEEEKEEPKQPQVARLKKRQEKFNILFANAI